MSHTSGEAETLGGGMLGWGEMQGETKGGGRVVGKMWEGRRPAEKVPGPLATSL